jgi:hypothetical protein
MIRNYGKALAEIATMLIEFENLTAHKFRREPDGSISQSDRAFADKFRAMLGTSLNLLREMNLNLTNNYGQRVLGLWDSQGLEVVLHHNMLTGLRERMIEELSLVYFFYVSPKCSEIYLKPLAGWEEVLVRFPEARMDVEEMNKCFALARYAAAVFHSVSAIEHGLIDLGKLIGVTDPKSGWTAVSNQLERLVTKTKFSELDPKHQSCFQFLEQTNGTIAALKNAWRNKISHAHGRLAVLGPDFTPEVADEIIVATRAFMRRLATEMPQ